MGWGWWGDGDRSGECIVSYLLMWAATTGDLCGTSLPPSLQARTHGSLRTRTTRVKLPENESPFAVHAESQLDPGKVGGLREFSLWNPSTEYQVLYTRATDLPCAMRGGSPARPGPAPTLLIPSRATGLMTIPAWPQGVPNRAPDTSGYIVPSHPYPAPKTKPKREGHEIPPSPRPSGPY